jgi:4-hydroxy-4-methyl-2-oxoglutarate aldolase
MNSADLIKFADLGVATVYEAAGRTGLIEAPLIQLLPESRVAGPARTVRCGSGDNLMVHAVLDQVRPGEILVLTLPEPEPVALVGELLATQAHTREVAALLVDAAVRDSDDLRALGLPIWTRFVRVRGATKSQLGTIGEPVVVGGAKICTGDLIVLDADGGVVVPASRIAEVLDASRERLEREAALREKLKAGALSYDLHGLREKVEGDSS